MVPLRRNRDFVLLQGGQLLSEAGSQATGIAYPLLVLAFGGSAAEAGLVAFARVVPYALFGLLAGVVADRFDRRAVMIAADAVRALAVLALVFDVTSVALVAAVAFVEGAGSAFFMPAAAGALRSVVAPDALPDAAGVQQGRLAIVRIAGPPLGGALFALGRAAPFVFDAVSYALSIVSLALMRTPFQTARRRGRAPLREGWRFLWGEPFLRVTTFLYGLGNFVWPGVLLVVVVVAERDGLAPAAIGLLLAAFGLSLLAGSLLSPRVRRTLPSRRVLLLELWVGLGIWAFVVWPTVYVLVVALIAVGLAMPSTDSVVIGHRLQITPDALVGRVESVRGTIALSLAPLGPLVAGALLEVTSARVTVAAFAALCVVLAAWGTLSRGLSIR